MGSHEENVAKTVKLIEDEAEKLRYQRPRFFHAIDNLRQRGNVSSVTRVEELIAETQSLLKELHSARQQNERLRKEVDPVTKNAHGSSQKAATSSQMEQRYQKELEQQKNYIKREVAMHEQIRVEMEHHFREKLKHQQVLHDKMVVDLRQLSEEMEAKFQSELSEREQHHNRALEKQARNSKEVEESFQEVQAKLTAEHKIVLKDVEEKFKAELARELQVQEQMQQSFEQEMTQQQQFLSDALLKQSQNQQELEQRHEREVKKLQHDHGERIARMERDNQEKLDQLEIKHVFEKSSLLKETDAYGAALLTHDDFQPTPDIEIQARFLDLVYLVDDLGRMEWRTEPQPSSHEHLPRMVKKCFLQDTIWNLLHEFIFCSPFRIFGEEGIELEKQWNEECGTDPERDNGHYTWPTPSIETERWRYITVKECYAALQKPVPSKYDPRARLKFEFSESISDLKERMTSTLGEIAKLGDSETRAITKLVTRAAKVWLEFGLQRCRVLIVLEKTEPLPVLKRLELAQEGSLRLTVIPQLQRQGLSTGHSLVESPVVIGGCKGETVEVAKGDLVNESS